MRTLNIYNEIWEAFGLPNENPEPEKNKPILIKQGEEYHLPEKIYEEYININFIDNKEKSVEFWYGNENSDDAENSKLYKVYFNMRDFEPSCNRVAYGMHNDYKEIYTDLEFEDLDKDEIKEYISLTPVTEWEVISE